MTRACEFRKAATRLVSFRDGQRPFAVCRQCSVEGGDRDCLVMDLPADEVQDDPSPWESPELDIFTDEAA